MRPAWQWRRRRRQRHGNHSRTLHSSNYTMHAQRIYRRAMFESIKYQIKQYRPLPPPPALRTRTHTAAIKLCFISFALFFLWSAVGLIQNGTEKNWMGNNNVSAFLESIWIRAIMLMSYEQICMIPFVGLTFEWNSADRIGFTATQSARSVRRWLWNDNRWEGRQTSGIAWMRQLLPKIGKVNLQCTQ